MRENRTCSSEGGEPGDRASLPYRRDPKFHSRMEPACLGVGLTGNLNNRSERLNVVLQDVA